jgi:hypothetical protein
MISGAPHGGNVLKTLLLDVTCKCCALTDTGSNLNTYAWLPINALAR